MRLILANEPQRVTIAQYFLDEKMLSVLTFWLKFFYDQLREN